MKKILPVLVLPLIVSCAHTPPVRESVRTVPSQKTEEMSGPAAPAEEKLPVGTLDFQDTPLDRFLTAYADFVGRTLLRPVNLDLTPRITLKNTEPLTRTEAIQAMEAALVRHNLVGINVGNKYLKIVPIFTQCNEGSASLIANFATPSADPSTASKPATPNK